MDRWIGLTTVLLPLIDLVLWGSYLWLFVAEREVARRWSRLLVAAALGLHLLHVGLQTAVHGHFPMDTPLEFLSVLATTLLLLYVIIERVLRVRQTGFLVVGLVFLMQFLASAFSAESAHDNPLLRDPGFTGHAVLVLLAYTAMSLSFLYAVLYLVQARQLSRRNFGLLFHRLPPLETLERMSVGAARMGVPLLFLSLAAGHLWMYDLRDRLPADLAGDLSPFDPKIIMSWVIFIGYAIGLIGHARWGWRGRRMNRVAVIVWILVIATMGLVRHLVPSFHDFTLRGGA